MRPRSTEEYGVLLVEWATRMALEARKDPAMSPGAITRIADQLGLHPEALRTWVEDDALPHQSA
jgi:transposase